MRLAIHPSSIAIQSVSAFLGGAFVMALQGPMHGPNHQDAQALPTCAKTIEDVTTGNCIQADSTPTLGSLYPLSPNLNVDPFGNVGIGTTTPNARLEVAGGANFNGPLGIGISDPQADLHVERQDGDPPARILLASGVGPSNRSSAELRTSNSGFFGEAALTLTGSGCCGFAQVILSDPGMFNPVTLRHYWDEGRFEILQGDVYLLGMTGIAPTTLGLSSQITVGDRAAYGAGSCSQYDLIASTTLRVRGDASQTLENSGFLKAGCHINGTVDPPSVDRCFNNLPLGCPPYSTEAQRQAPGIYEVVFSNVLGSGEPPVNLDTRFFQATLGSATNTSVPAGFIQTHPGTNSVIVETFDVTGARADNQFFLAVY